MTFKKMLKIYLNYQKLQVLTTICLDDGQTNPMHHQHQFFFYIKKFAETNVNKYLHGSLIFSNLLYSALKSTQCNRIRTKESKVASRWKLIWVSVSLVYSFDLHGRGTLTLMIVIQFSLSISLAMRLWVWYFIWGYLLLLTLREENSYALIVSG